MLDERTRELVAIGASLTANCKPCLEYHVAKARELGVDEVDIGEAVKTGQQVRRGAMAKMDRFAAQLVSGPGEAIPPAGCECR